MRLFVWCVQLIRWASSLSTNRQRGSVIEARRAWWWRDVESPQHTQGRRLVGQLLTGLCLFLFAETHSASSALMAATGTQLTSLLLAEDHTPLWHPSDTKTPADPTPRPRFDVNSEWPDRGRPLHSLQFDPLLRSAFFHSIGRHRAYYPLFLLLIATSMLLVLQPWLSAALTTALQLCVVLLLWVPLLLVECTRLDRHLLRQLLGSFDFFFLMANWVACQTMVFIACDGTFAAVGNAVSINLVYGFFSLFTFGMDALPEVQNHMDVRIHWMDDFSFRAESCGVGELRGAILRVLLYHHPQCHRIDAADSNCLRGQISVPSDSSPESTDDRATSCSHHHARRTIPAYQPERQLNGHGNGIEERGTGLIHSRRVF